MTSPVTLGSIISRQRPALILSALLSVVASGLSLAPYIAVYAATESLFGDDPDSPSITTIAIWTAVAIAARMVAAALSGHIAHLAAYRILADLRIELVAKLRRIPLGAVLRRPSGEIKKTLGDDVEQLEEALAHGIPDLAAAGAVPVTTTALLFIVDWRLACVAFGTLVLLLVISGAAMAAAKDANVEYLRITTRLNNAVTGYLRGIKVIRAYLRPDGGYDQVRREILNSYGAQRTLVTLPLMWVIAGMSALAGLAVAVLVPFVGFGYLHGWVSLGTLALFLLIGLAYLSPIMSIVGVLATLMTRLTFARDSVTALLAEPELPMTDDPRRPAGPGPVEVRFESVTFGYGTGTDKLVFDSLDLTVAAGSTTAIVGATGSGKSTLARLIARFWDADSGAVRIGDVDVREFSAQGLADTVAFVQQDEFVFGGSLIDNIGIARVDATEDEIIAAGRAAQLDDVAASLPGGWHGPLPPGGALSGGQRQRISIARALLKNASVVVFDEATASLDSETEAATLTAMTRLTAGRTTISIAHRLATIRDADRIVVLDAGLVVGSGTHSQLLDSSERYRELWRTYETAAGWQLHAADATAPLPVAGLTDTAIPATPPDEFTVAADALVRPGLGDLGFVEQWRVLIGRGWGTLGRQALPRLVLEGLVRGIPIVGVYLLLRAVIDAEQGGELFDGGFVWGVCALVVAGIVARLFAARWVNTSVFVIAGRAKADIQVSLVERLRRVALGFFDRADVSRTGSTITQDVPMLDFQNVPQMVAAAVVQPCYLVVVLAVIDWRLALAALAGIPAFLAATWVADRIFHRAFTEVHAARAEVSVALVDQARGAAIIRANPASAFARRHLPAIEALRRASIAMSVRAMPALGIGAVAIELGLVGVIVVGAWLYQAGEVSASVLLMFWILTLVMYQPIQQLADLAGYRRNQQQLAARVAEIWDEPQLPEPAEPQPAQDSSIEFDAVDFAYRSGGDARPVLQDVTLRAEPGTITALVGRSGAGKSTVANLLARSWDVDSGSVRIGGVDIRALGSAQIAHLTTTVFQDSYLFAGTVRFNLTLGRPDADDDAVWAALDAAQCADVVRALPRGLDTEIAEGGADLSGGQRQRLCIARALLKDSPILILDEAVASVDPDTEARIQDALSVLMAGRTVLVIAHRLTTLRNVDQIIVLERGRVTDAGSPDRVLPRLHGSRRPAAERDQNRQDRMSVARMALAPSSES